MMQTQMPDGGILVHEESVQSSWVDYNGHMNVAFYVLVFDHGTDAVLDHLGLDEDYRAKTDSSVFVVEAHINYLREVVENDSLQVSSLMLGFDEKRLHLFHHMYHRETGALCATNEVLLVYVDMKSRRTAPFPKAAKEILQNFSDNQQAFQHPPQAGSVIGVKRR